MSGYVCDHYIGLAVGDTILRSVVIEAHEKQISSLVEEHISGHILNGGKIINPELFKKTLYHLVKKSKKRASCVSISLPEKYALTRELSFPNLSDREIEEAVRWQAKNIFPLPLDEMYLDWKIIPSETGEKEIFLVALPKRLVDDLISIVTSLGLRPVNIQTSATCLARMLSPTGNNLQALVNLSEDGITSTLVKGRITRLTATDDYVDGRNIVKSVQDTIEKLVNYYIAKGYEDITLEHIWLTGANATEDVKIDLKKALGVKVDYLEGPIKFSDKSKMLAFSEAIAIGLSLIKPPSSDETINLIPKPVERYYDSSDNLGRIRSWEKTVVGILSIGLFIVIISYAFLFFQAHLLVADTSGEFLSTNKLGEVIVQESSDSTEVQLRKINKQVDKLLVLSELKSTPRNLFKLLPEISVDGVVINSWSYNDDEKLMVLNGVAQSRDKLLEYQQKIEEQEEFLVAVIPLENLEKKSNFVFSIKVSTK